MTTARKQVVFYDIMSKENVGPWSPNTWKTRLSLNYKGIPYTTQFISYPDIKPRMEAIGAALGYSDPAHGGDVYTLPAIQDGDVTVVESLKIALYLDEVFPGPKLFPSGTRALQFSFLRWHGVTVFNAVVDICCAASADIVDPRSETYMRRTRAEWYGKPLEEWVTDRAAEWVSIREAYNKLATIYAQADEEFGIRDAWLMGEHPTFADFVVAACLLWIKKVIRQPDEGWELMQHWNDGRWDRLLKKCEPYMCED